MDPALGNILFKNVYLEDILISSKGNFMGYNENVEKNLTTLDNNHFAVKWLKCIFYKKDIEFTTWKIGMIPLEDKILAIKSIPIPRNLKELRSFFGSTKQFMKFVPIFAPLGSLLRSLLNKKSIFTWSSEYTI